MARRVLLHVGTPKTGTSSLQDVLFRNHDLLAESGIAYVADRFDAHFLAALDLLGLEWGGLEREAVGAWDELARRVRAHDGQAIVSHEVLASATRAQAERALASLGHGQPGTEVHVVLSARDLVRQVPAEWQENVKHRRTLDYAAFLEAIRAPERTSPTASWFWAVQDLPQILDRWTADLPAAQVHVVTVPPSGGPPQLLWERFVATFGLGGLDLDLGEKRANPSLGVPEIALLRRINEHVVDHLPPEHYRPLVRELLAHTTLSQRRSSARLGLPPDLAAWAQDTSRGWVDVIAARGYDVVGGLDELVGIAPAGWSDPDDPDHDELLEAALAAIDALLLDGVAVRADQQRLQAEVDELRDTRVSRTRRQVVDRLEAGRSGRAVLRGYRGVRWGRRARGTT